MHNQSLTAHPQHHHHKQNGRLPDTTTLIKSFIRWMAPALQCGEAAVIPYSFDQRSDAV